MEALLNYGTINARSLDSAELPKKRQFCFARDDRNEFIQSFVGSWHLGHEMWAVSHAVIHSSGKIPHYFPMQKVLKISPRISSVVVAPVISSRGRRAL